MSFEEHVNSTYIFTTYLTSTTKPSNNQSRPQYIKFLLHLQLQEVGFDRYLGSVDRGLGQFDPVPAEPETGLFGLNHNGLSHGLNR